MEGVCNEIMYLRGVYSALREGEMRIVSGDVFGSERSKGSVVCLWDFFTYVLMKL